VSVYLDTSAAAKFLVDEAESAALAGQLDEIGDEQAIVSSALLETELRRLSVRLGLDQSAVSDLLARINLVDLPRSLFHEAGLLPGARLRSVDAIHLATALRVDADALVAYDLRLLHAARSLGLGVLTPT